VCTDTIVTKHTVSLSGPHCVPISFSFSVLSLLLSLLFGPELGPSTSVRVAASQGLDRMWPAWTSRDDKCNCVICGRIVHHSSRPNPCTQPSLRTRSPHRIPHLLRPTAPPPHKRVWSPYSPSAVEGIYFSLILLSHPSLGPGPSTYYI